MMSIRVLVADDHQIIRQGLKLLFNGAEDMELVGEAEDGRQAVELAHELSPDVVVMDIGMPEMDGLEATRLVRRDQPHTKVVGLSMHNDEAFVEGMKQAGAHGYVLKEAAFEELLQAIREVNDGRSYFNGHRKH